MPNEPSTNPGEQAYERYNLLKEHRAENDIPGDDLLPHDTRITQSLSESGDESAGDAEYGAGALDPLPDVPDADAIQQDSPVDPSAPDPDAMHGTDLLNGYDGDDSQ
ncbi:MULTISPECIES: hypothetical protein [Paenibacillus]|uniref:hypothetical protein n=1 Tax=Paenibacillus TaxID=44249 RepID=UPI002FE2D488